MTLDIELFRDVFNASPIGIAVETLEGQPQPLQLPALIWKVPNPSRDFTMCSVLDQATGKSKW